MGCMPLIFHPTPLLVQEWNGPLHAHAHAIEFNCMPIVYVQADKQRISPRGWERWFRFETRRWNYPSLPVQRDTQEKRLIIAPAPHGTTPPLPSASPISPKPKHTPLAVCVWA